VDALIQPGQVLRMERGEALVTVGECIGQGGQGVVHRARLGSALFAVKWIRPGPGEADTRRSITALIQRGQPPHKAFAWPIDMVTSPETPGFGYVMPLLEPRFVSVPQVLNSDIQPSFRALTAVGRELVDAFAALHSSGLCYRDISFGNLRVDPVGREVAIIDVDNIGLDGGDALVKGTGPFMAPEVLRDEALPSTVTDLHSLAVLLFYLLMHGHPLIGERADAYFNWAAGHLSETEVTLRNFGTHPLFIFDPDDASNRPLHDDPVRVWWPIYPRHCRRIFAQAFTTGLGDATLSGRVKEGTWRRTLLRLHDGVTFCLLCGAETFHDPERGDQPCWQCHAILPVPSRLQAPGGTLVLCDGARVTSHHLFRDRDHRTTLAAVSPHPAEPGRFVMRNMTSEAWVVAPDGESPKPVHPGQRLAVRPMHIDFGGVTARIDQ
jgi:eukaryotic-like serine/threonine-protein kinase